MNVRLLRGVFVWLLFAAVGTNWRTGRDWQPALRERGKPAVRALQCACNNVNRRTRAWRISHRR